MNGQTPQEYARSILQHDNLCNQCTFRGVPGEIAVFASACTVVFSGIDERMYSCRGVLTLFSPVESFLIVHKLLAASNIGISRFIKSLVEVECDYTGRVGTPTLQKAY